MAGPEDNADKSRGIKSVEIGYGVLLAIQQGPAPVQLSDVAKRTGLSSGAAHNYIASLIRTGLVEQEGRGRYRLGPSAFALSLASFHLLDGYDVLRGEAATLQKITRANVAVSVWSQGGPVSVFIQRTDNLSSIEFRSGLFPMLASAAGELIAAYLPESITEELIEHELEENGRTGARAFIEEARSRVLPFGYARFVHNQPNHYALAAPVWTGDDRIAFIISVVAAQAPGSQQEATNIRALLDSTARASLLIGATCATGPRSPFRNAMLA
jgi:DNA-binding IclR family transcriptional regulator